MNSYAAFSCRLLRLDTDVLVYGKKLHYSFLWVGGGERESGERESWESLLSADQKDLLTSDRF